MQASGSTVTLPELERVAAQLWRELPPASVVWLSGDLGTGKTAFVQAVARAAAARSAKSPTFALVHHYESPAGRLIHVDCYRLRTPDEALDLDFPGLLRDARLMLIEWPEQAGDLAPLPTVHLRFSHVSEPDRRGVERIR
jgi:tRNA threonylcarbamoyladenosine biosynthesis protein TsaE